MDGGGKGADEEAGEDEMCQDKIFKNLSYVGFGLGNRTYEHYNAIIRRVSKRFKKCGASLIGEIGEGDDDACLEEDFLNWQTKTLPIIAEYFGVKAINKRELPHVPLFEVSDVQVTADMEKRVFYGEHTSRLPRRWKKSAATKKHVEVR